MSQNREQILKASSKRGALPRFLTLFLIVSFILNWCWEMAQMPGYREMASRSWRETVTLCTRAALGDLAITLLIYAIGALAARSLSWGLRATWNVYLVVALLGAMQALWIERAAIASGRWTYTQSMPLLPVLEVGLWPLLQLSLLTPLTFWMANRCLLVTRTHAT